MTYEMHLKGVVFNYILSKEGQLILNISAKGTSDKAIFLDYVIDTNDGAHFHHFCENMLLYNRIGQVIFDFLPETRVKIEAIEAEGCISVTALRLDLESYQ